MTRVVPQYIRYIWQLSHENFPYLTHSTKTRHCIQCHVFENLTLRYKPNPPALSHSFCMSMLYFLILIEFEWGRPVQAYFKSNTLWIQMDVKLLQIFCRLTETVICENLRSATYISVLWCSILNDADRLFKFSDFCAKTRFDMFIFAPPQMQSILHCVSSHFQNWTSQTGQNIDPPIFFFYVNYWSPLI